MVDYTPRITSEDMKKALTQDGFSYHTCPVLLSPEEMREVVERNLHRLDDTKYDIPLKNIR